MSFKRILDVNLKVKKHENVLIVIDENYDKIGSLMFDFCVKRLFETVLLKIKERKINGENPPKAVANAMKKSDVIIILTKKSMTHAKATLDAVKSGARIASMPGVLDETIARALSADLKKMDQLGRKLFNVLNKGKVVHVKSENGTDIKLYICNRKPIIMNGAIDKKGSLDNLPAGEVSLSPTEGSSNGVVVFDGSCAGIGLLKRKIEIVVEKGYAVEINGGKDAPKLKRMLAPFGKQAFNIAELGFGTNEKARLTGSVLEDEKVLGTVHIALGNNSAYGGKIDVPTHIDGIILKPTVFVDGNLILKNGKYLI